MVGSFEHSNELLSSTEVGNFLTNRATITF